MSADPAADPEIDPHYFEEEIGACGVCFFLFFCFFFPSCELETQRADGLVACADLATFIDSVRFVRTVAKAAPLKDHLGAFR